MDFMVGAALGAAVGLLVGWVLGVEFGGPRVVYEQPKVKKTRGGLGGAQGISDEELEKAIRERVEELEREGA